MDHTPSKTNITSAAQPISVKEIIETGEVASDDNRAVEFGGTGGLEPTRYGDWEKKGRCIDF